METDAVGPRVRHWLADPAKEKLVNLLDDTHLSASQAHPTLSESDDQIALCSLISVVSRIFRELEPDGRMVESDRGSSSRRRLNRRDGRGILP